MASHFDHRSIFDGPMTCGRAIMLIALVTCGCGVWPSPAHGEEQAEGPPTWKTVEALPRFKQIVDSLKANGPFNDEARNFLETSILPLLEIDANLSNLDDIRKKIRDRFLLVIGDGTAFTDASDFVCDRMLELARNSKVHPLVQVQAMMLVGDLVDKGRLPWIPALETLAAAIRDPSLAPGPRVAAMAGIANHVNALNRFSSEQSKKVKETAVSVLTGLLKAPPPPGDKKAAPTRPDEDAWMASRGLPMLPQVLNPATPEVAAVLMTTIDDPSWPIDVRVRAAAALGRIVGPNSGVDGLKAVSTIKELAIVSLEADRADARHSVEARCYKEAEGKSASPEFYSQLAVPPIQEGIRESVCRRAAWRLYTLGDAIDPKASKGGLAALLDKDAREAKDAKQLAMDLKEAGEVLDTVPGGDNLLVALDKLDPAGAKKRAAEFVRQRVSEPNSEVTDELPEQDEKPTVDGKPASEPAAGTSSDPF